MSAPATPRFSVIVPTHRRPLQLARCLDALARLDYPRHRFEVIVVDDGSDAPPEDVVARWRGALNVTLVAHRANAGPARARNTGAARAAGELLAFTDDDCAPDPGWLRTLDAHLAADPDALVGGRTINGLTRNHYASASQLLIDYLYIYYHARPSGTGESTPFFTSNNLAVSAAGFRSAGGFDETYPRAAAEDRDFCDRWLHAGRRLRYADDVIVYHYHDLDLRSFCRQHVHYGSGALSFHSLRAQRAQRRVTLEPLAFYVNLLRYPFTQRSTSVWSQARAAALIALSQGAYAAGFFSAHLARMLWNGDRTKDRPRGLRDDVGGGASGRRAAEPGGGGSAGPASGE